MNIFIKYNESDKNTYTHIIARINNNNWEVFADHHDHYSEMCIAIAIPNCRANIKGALFELAELVSSGIFKYTETEDGFLPNVWDVMRIMNSVNIAFHDMNRSA